MQSFNSELWVHWRLELLSSITRNSRSSWDLPRLFRKHLPHNPHLKYVRRLLNDYRFFFRISAIARMLADAFSRMMSFEWLLRKRRRSQGKGEEKMRRKVKSVMTPQRILIKPVAKNVSKVTGLDTTLLWRPFPLLRSWCASWHREKEPLKTISWLNLPKMCGTESASAGRTFRCSFKKVISRNIRKLT